MENNDSVNTLNKGELQAAFAEAVKLVSTHVRLGEVIPIGQTQYHMWLLRDGELRKIPDMAHEAIAKGIFAKMQLSGSVFFDNDGTRFRERAICDAGIIKVCSHDRQ